MNIQLALVYPTTFANHKMRQINHVLDKPGVGYIRVNCTQSGDGDSQRSVE